MAKPTTPHDGVTVVIPAHNAAAQLEKMLPAWGLILGKQNRPIQIIVVNDGSTDGTAALLEKLATRVAHLRVLTHDTRRGFGACLRTALAETTHPLFMYAGFDNQYTPGDIRSMLERIELRDEIFGKQPDLISGFRAGRPRPTLVKWVSGAWKRFWRVFAGLPIVDSPPWYGWGEWWYKTRAGWVFGVPLADVNSAFKLYRTAFLKRVPIQSDGDFVHVELVAKATFLTSIMDEIPLTPKTEPFPPLGPVSADRGKVFRDPKFAFDAPAETKPPEAGNAAVPPVPPVTEATAAPAATSKPVESVVTTPAESVPAPKADASPVPSKSEPVVEQPPPSPPAKAPENPPPPAPGAPVVEAPKPNESSTNTTHTQAPPSEATKSAEEEPPEPAPPASPPPPAAETNAGGLASPGSPVPAS